MCGGVSVPAKDVPGLLSLPANHILRVVYSLSVYSLVSLSLSLSLSAVMKGKELKLPA